LKDSDDAKNGLQDNNRQLKELNDSLSKFQSDSEAEQAKQNNFMQKLTILPADEQLSPVERDLLDFFLGSPGIGMITLSFAFFSSRTDLGAKIKDLAQSKLNQARNVLKDPDDEENKIEIPSVGGFSKIDKISSNEVKSLKLEPPPQWREMGRVQFWTTVLSGLMPIIILCVQFAYIFFIFYEAWRLYNGGFCPGYDISKQERIDPDDGSDTRTRILIGFVAAYFIFKNISQLIAYQRALSGNPPADPEQQKKKTGFLGGLVGSGNPAVQTSGTKLGSEFDSDESG
jgi:hypothetical protein